MMTDTVASSGRCRRPRRVQVWLRVPKVWDNFLEAKAAREGCTKSDLLRYAFNQAFDSELRAFLADNPVRPGRDGFDASAPEPTGSRCVATTAPATIPLDLEDDPWMESMAAFVANKGSPQTRRAYRLALSQFFTFVGKHPGDVRQSDAIRYRLELEKVGKASSTIRLDQAAISGYYSFCMTRGIARANPTTGVHRPPVDAYSSASWLSTARAKHLLSQPNRETVKGKRDYAMLLTYLLTALRCSELANIKRGHIQETGEKIYLTYTCKGGVRLVRDIPRRCWEVIQDYLTASGREITGDSPLFTATTGSNGHHPITAEAIRKMVTHYSRQAFGDTIKVTPHSLRHTAGTLLRKSGCSVEEVQSFLKHKRLDTTRGYLHVVEATDSEFGEYIAGILDL